MTNDKVAMPDDKLRKFLNVLLNVWFLKWKRKKKMTDADWGSCIEELDRIISQGEQYPVVDALSMALLHELDLRSRDSGENRKKV